MPSSKCQQKMNSVVTVEVPCLTTSHQGAGGFVVVFVFFLNYFFFNPNLILYVYFFSLFIIQVFFIYTVASSLRFA